MRPSAKALAAEDELGPALLHSVIAGATTTPDRCRSMAGVLRAIGADEQADQLLLEVSAYLGKKFFRSG